MAFLTSFTCTDILQLQEIQHCFLIAVHVSPAGTISFVSCLWDKYLTQQSGFLRLLETGDTVLADRGFEIAYDIVLHGGELAIPTFTNSKSQGHSAVVEFLRD